MTSEHITPSPIERVYSATEEIVNSVTHGLGAVLALIGMTLLLSYTSSAADGWKTLSFVIYGSSLTLLYVSSTLYHGVTNPRVKTALNLLDHCAIYLLIAGTYTPFLLVNMRGTVGWTLFFIIWALALTGIAIKLMFGSRFKAVRVLMYLLMGWLMIFAADDMVASVDPIGVKLIIIGGLSYSVGVIFYLLKQVPYMHAVWHLFVLGGSACHFAAIYGYVMPVTA